MVDAEADTNCWPPNVAEADREAEAGEEVFIVGAPLSAPRVRHAEPVTATPIIIIKLKFSRLWWYLFALKCEEVNHASKLGS